jgi:hypothetical protein
LDHLGELPVVLGIKDTNHRGSVDNPLSTVRPAETLPDSLRANTGGFAGIPYPDLRLRPYRRRREVRLR